MTFISYAQNFEDVMLWRALNHINNGFYIDVGAWSPDIDSVTRSFYEAGWTGVNVEPNPEFHEQLRDKRPNDLNLQCAISDQQGVGALKVLNNPGLTTLDTETANSHSEAWKIAEVLEVTTLTLTDLWNKYISSGQQVHFLKVDVEGFEEQVVAGNNWSENRPWVVVIEATLPMTQDENYAIWEKILTSNNYKFVYADGLNRFYVAQERNELLDAFKYPPNVFDDFILSRTHEAESKVHEAESKVHEAESKAYRVELQSNKH